MAKHFNLCFRTKLTYSGFVGSLRPKFTQTGVAKFWTTRTEVCVLQWYTVTCGSLDFDRCQRTRIRTILVRESSWYLTPKVPITLIHSLLVCFYTLITLSLHLIQFIMNPLTSYTYVVFISNTDFQIFQNSSGPWTCHADLIFESKRRQIKFYLVQSRC